MNPQTALDPQIVNLVKAIRQVESQGNFNAKGSSGEYGAYQFTPNTFAGSSQKFLGQSIPIEKATPQQQNEVAYKQVAEWKAQGYNVGQIASMWNAGQGKPNAYLEGNSGTNKFGVKYDTKEYAKNVAEAYQQFKAQTPQEGNAIVDNTPQLESRGILRNIGDFFTGGTQKFGNTIGESFAAPSGSEAYSNEVNKYTQVINQLASQRAKIRQAGGDTSKIDLQLKNEADALKKLKPEDFTGDVINKNAKQVIGEAGQFGLELTSGGVLGGGLKNVAAKELGIGSKLLQGAAVGAAYGGLGGGFNAMQNNENTQNILGEGLLGATIGGTLGAGLTGGGIVAGKIAGSLNRSGIVNKILPETEARIAKQMGWIKEAEGNIAKAYRDTLPLTPSEKVKEELLLKKTGDNIYSTLSKYNISADSEKAFPQLQEVSDKFETAINHAQDNEHGLFNVNEIKTNAFNEVNRNISSETTRETAKNKIVTEIDALLKANKDDVIRTADGKTMIKSNLVERLRRTGNSWTPFNASDPEKVGQSAGWALANAVRDQVDKEGTFPSYRYANSEWGKIIHAREVLQKLQDSGKTFRVLGGLSGSIARKVLSGVVGLHSGGIGGLVLGELSSEYLAKVISNPEIRTYFDRKLIEKFGNKKATPEAIFALEQEIKDYIDKKSSVLSLPAPSPLGSEKNPIITPAPTTYESAAGNINRSSSLFDNQKLLPASNRVPNNEVIQLGAPTSYEPAAKFINMMNSNPGDTIQKMLRDAKMRQALEAFLNEPYTPKEKLPIIEMGKVPKNNSGLPTIK